MDRKEFVFCDFVGFALCFRRLVSRFESGSWIVLAILILNCYYLVSSVCTWTMSFATAAHTDLTRTLTDVWHLKKNFNASPLKLGR